MLGQSTAGASTRWEEQPPLLGTGKVKRTLRIQAGGVARCGNSLGRTPRASWASAFGSLCAPPVFGWHKGGRKQPGRAAENPWARGSSHLVRLAPVAPWPPKPVQGPRPKWLVLQLSPLCPECREPSTPLPVPRAGDLGRVDARPSMYGDHTSAPNRPFRSGVAPVGIWVARSACW